MQLKSEMDSFSLLFNSVSKYYEDDEREVLIFEKKFPEEKCDSDYFVRFLVEKKHVVEYRISKDRGLFLSIVSVAIGPHYFVPNEYWDYKNSQRFFLEASTEAITRNLEILDEFFLTRI